MTLPVEVIRSRKRRKTVHAELLDGVVRVRMPAWIGEDEEREVVADLVAKLERRHTSQHVDLPQRAATLAATYDLPLPVSITWSDLQRKRWGSCSLPARTIRISTRLAAFPPWVLDSVIVHELAHLLEYDHSPRFYELVARYPHTAKADGFLLGVNYQGSDPGSDGIDAVDSAVDGADGDVAGGAAVAAPGSDAGLRPGRSRRARRPTSPAPAAEALTLF